MEKAFALKSAIPTLATNGRVAVYSTTDRRVNLILLVKDFDWPDQKKAECFRCPRCKHFILPTDKGKIKASLRYHNLCAPLKPIKEIHDEA